MSKKANSPSPNAKPATSAPAPVPTHSKASTTRRDKCSPRTCPDCDKLQTARASKGDVRDALINDIDWQHMKNEHFRLWGEYQAESRVAAETERDAAVAQLRKLQERITMLEGGARTAKKGAPVKLTVDPRNHSDGICDALISGPDGKTIWKCTDSCRYGTPTCGLHAGHVNLVAPGEK
jgi:hypothetical protein